MSDFNVITTAGRAWVSAASALQCEDTLKSAMELAKKHPDLNELTEIVRQGKGRF